MQPIELTWVDKSKWGDGPWQSEPDKVQWVDEETGLDCLVVRNHVGAWCGYVGVPESHPYFGKHYDHEDLRHIQCHGWLTFSGPCSEKNKERGICHIKEGEDKVWWLGFDCAHGCDISPALRVHADDEEYRTLDYVKNEVKNLTKQLKAQDL